MEKLGMIVQREARGKENVCGKEMAIGFRETKMRAGPMSSETRFPVTTCFAFTRTVIAETNQHSWLTIFR